MARCAHYKELKNSYIIFLCPFAMFDQLRHIYTFSNLCHENHDLQLNDGATKIFLCSDGELDDVSPDIKAFLDYMKGLPAKDDFVTEVNNLIAEIKTKEEERVSYMTYAMKIQEAHDDGRAEGLAEGEKNANLRTAKRMLAKNKPIEEILELVDLSKEEVEKLASQD